MNGEMPPTEGSIAPEAAPPHPKRGWSHEIVTLPGGIIVPPLDDGLSVKGGVLAADGRWCSHGATWRGKTNLNLPPTLPADVAGHLPGRWLWGGPMNSHFGHFLVESTCRVWALDKVGPIDGVVFMARRPHSPTDLHPFQQLFFDALDFRLPVRIVNEATRVDELIVPGQGFGLGGVIRGTIPYRQYFAANFGKTVAPAGPERIYISRSMFGAARGGILAEDVLEANLIAEGYSIFHPERHTLDDQIAHYRAARQIISLDGSALHLYALAAGPGQRAAVILRRSSNVTAGLLKQMAYFCPEPTLVIRALQREWARKSIGRSNRLSIGELDFTATRQLLLENGFISGTADWQIPDAAFIAQAVAAAGQKQKDEYIPIELSTPR